MSYIFTGLTFFYLLVLDLESSRNMTLNICIIVVLYLLILAQIIFEVYISYKKQNQLPLPGLIKNRVISHYIHMVVFPSVLYFLTAFAVVIYDKQVLTYILIFLSSIFYFFISESINGNNGIINEGFNLTYNHLSAYDGVSIYLFFIGLLDCINLFSENSINYIFVISGFSIILLLLFLIRYKQFNYHGILLILLVCIVLDISYIILVNTLRLGILEVILFELIGFYYLMILLHHRIEGNLSYAMIIEYIMFGLIAIVTTLFIFIP